MLTLSGPHADHLAGDTTQLCTLWRITRRDAAVYRYTDHDRDIAMPADGTYLAAAGYTASAARTEAGLNVDDLEVAAVFDDAAITEADLDAGLWDGAVVEVFSAIWSAPGAGARPVRKGRIGRVAYDSAAYRAELLGLTQAMAANVGRVIGPGCDAILGDARCGKDLTAFTHALEVTAVASRLQFTDSALAQAAGYFNFGAVHWTTGANAGRVHEVKIHATGGVLTLFLPAPGVIAVGDTAQIVAGCDKQLATCRDAFDNVVNFRGFPAVPGNDRIFAPKVAG